MKIAVVGNGVIGLSLTLELIERGHQVSVYGATQYSESTSYVAGALWYPSKLEPDEKARSWALQSLEVFKSLAKINETGVRILPIRRWFHRRMGRPWWAESVTDFKLLYPEECEGARCGYLFNAPVIDMPIYLAWLHETIASKGAVFHFQKITSLSQFSRSYDCYINCTGIAARELCQDSELVPVRGITLIIQGADVVTEAFMDWDDPQGISYIVPRGNSVVLGGSEEREPYEEIDFVAQKILDRCYGLNPSLRKNKSIETRFGYRPVRSRVRLECDSVHPKWIHNYGHGGSGVTLSWGCAAEVVKLLENF